MTDLALIEASWDKAARENATYNILTNPTHRDGWPTAEFFATGKGEIDAAMQRLQVRVRLGRALDFGCGIGRLTQALAGHFKRANGVDVSAEMIARARSHNSYPGRVEYHTNGERLPFADGTFDFVYSMIVLQHMPQDMQKGYVTEFFRVLKPDGVAMFHTPDGPDSGHPGWHLSMYGVDRGTVEDWIMDAGGVLADVEDLGQDCGWRNLRYTATA